MSSYKEFFSKKVFINCLVFALLISTVMVWRHCHNRHIELLSKPALIFYIVAVMANFTGFGLVLFLLFKFNNRQS